MYFFDEIIETINEEIAEGIGGVEPHDPLVRACQSIVVSLRKKFTGDTSSTNTTADHRKDVALRRFLRRNDVCAALNGSFDGFTSLSDSHQEIVGNAKAWLTSVLGKLDEACADPAHAYALSVPGPGSAIGAIELDAYTKTFDGPLLFPSQGALLGWYLFTQTSELRRSAEDVRAAKHGCPGIQPYAKWSSVPKTIETDRSIVITSVGGLLCQRSLGLHLESVLADIGMAVNTQPDFNRAMAAIGSRADIDLVDPNYRPCTIDWSDASDSLYFALVEWFFQFLPNLWARLIESRDGILHSGENDRVNLAIFSTMGNGFTFPLQTLIFSAIAYGALCSRAGAKKFRYYDEDLRTIGCFGDDLVVPRLIYDDVLSVTLAMGLLPNVDKSYGAGPFRESCGTDWFDGSNVRGVYCEDLASPTQRVILFNRLAEWSATWLPLPRTLQRIWDAIPRSHRNFVPLWEDCASGVRIPSKTRRPGSAGTLLVNRDLRQNLSKTLRISLGAYAGDYVYRPFRTVARNHNLAQVLPEPFIVDDRVEVTVYPRRWYIGDDERSRTYEVRAFRVDNPFGYLLSLIQGSVKGQNAAIRSNDGASYSQHGYDVVPNWDRLPRVMVYDAEEELFQEQFNQTQWPFGKPRAWSARFQELIDLYDRLAFLPR